MASSFCFHDSSADATQHKHTKCKQMLSIEHDADCLSDSGAAHKLIDKAFITKHGLRPASCSGRVVCAGKKDVSVSHYVRVRLFLLLTSQAVFEPHSGSSMANTAHSNYCFCQSLCVVHARQTVLQT